MIINLTQHPATPEQVVAGVIDLSKEDREFLVRELTFDSLPTQDEIRNRAENKWKIFRREGKPRE